MSDRFIRRYALLASGSGTTAEKIIQACRSEDGLLYGLIEPACLIASKPDIGAIKKAIEAGISKDHIYVVEPKGFSSPDKFGGALIKIFRDEDINLFGQHGWLPKTPGNVVDEFIGINQHPGPVPHFGGQGMYGRRVHSAILHFRRLSKNPIWTEATAQLVAPEFDAGKVILSQPIPVHDDDTVETLQSRVLPVEHLVQILALMKIVAYNGIHFNNVDTSSPIFANELQFLEKAKELAIADYPHG